MRELVLPADGRGPGSGRIPGAEGPGRFDLSGGNRVGQRRAERHRPIEADRLHLEIVNRKHARQLVRIAGNDDELGVLRLELFDDHRTRDSRAGLFARFAVVARFAAEW